MASKECSSELADKVAAEKVEKTVRRRRPRKANAEKVYRLLADASNVSLQQAQKFVDVLPHLAIQELHETGSFTVPNLVSFKAVKRKATPAKTKKMFGKEYRIEAQPMRTILKATIMQQLQDGLTTK
eukprot:12405881-Karenia_brevis.AAC.2